VKKILVVYPYIPYPLDRGTYQRTFHLLRELARTHAITFVALAENNQGLEHKPLFEQFCERVEFVPFVHPPWPKFFPDRLLNPIPVSILHWKSDALERKLDEVLSQTKFDAVHVCDLVMANYFAKGSRAKLPLVVDRSRVDLQFQLAEHSRMNFPLRTRLMRYEGYAKMWAYERKMAKHAKLEVVCGPDDKTFLRKYINRDMEPQVLVNGVDLDFFCTSEEDEARAAEPTIIFCGAMDYNPNIDALRWYFAEMHDALRRLIPNLHVLVVGKDPIAEVKAHANKPNVTVTGSVPDVRPFYRQAWMQIVPLRIGGGTRLKIVESLAIRTPVVSTTIGAQGLHLQHDKDILLADTAEDFVQQTARALKDAKLRKHLEVAGLQTARSRFSWKMIGAQLSGVYETLLATDETQMKH
jgi:glycosyltransferase involved in cell wall biosynthesis